MRQARLLKMKALAFLVLTDSVVGPPDNGRLGRYSWGKSTPGVRDVRVNRQTQAYL